MPLSGWSGRACSLKRGTYNVQQQLISARLPKQTGQFKGERYKVWPTQAEEG
jgi:hypothetical protein